MKTQRLQQNESHCEALTFLSYNDEMGHLKHVSNLLGRNMTLQRRNGPRFVEVAEFSSMILGHVRLMQHSAGAAISHVQSCHL